MVRRSSRDGNGCRQWLYTVSASHLLAALARIPYRFPWVNQPNVWIYGWMSCNIVSAWLPQANYVFHQLGIPLSSAADYRTCFLSVSRLTLLYWFSILVLPNKIEYDIF